jgi:phosphoglycolate phosphatase
MPPPSHRFRAVVFDLDGTLIDSAPDIADAINMVLADLGRIAVREAVIREMVGTGWAGLLERIMEMTGGEPDKGLDWAVERFRECYVPRSTRLSSLYPTAMETVQLLHGQGLKLGICTNKRQEATDVVVQNFGLTRYMDSVIGGDTTGAMKPDPRHLGAVLGELGIEGSAALMVGDSKADVAAARALDMPVVVVSYGYTAIPARDLDGDALIDRLSELPDLLATL